MSKIKSTITVSATFSLNEDELRALDAIAGYGDDEFLQVFYEKLGQSYMKPHENGLRSLFATIRRDVPTALAKVDKARKLLIS